MRIRVSGLLSTVLLLTSYPTMAQSWDDLWLTADQQGKRALERGENEAATELFKNPDWAGTAAYRSDDFEAAEQHFSKSETASSLYNKGNALAKGGKLDDAINAYKDVLELEPDATDAAENLALLEKLKEQQEQQEQQQQDGGENSDEENQDESEQQQDSDSEQDDQQNEQSGEQNDQQSDQENQPPENEQPSDSEESEESESDAEQNEQQEDQQQPAEPEEEPTKEEQEAAAAQAEETSEQDKEEEQAMQQWLRRIPDDPSGLLREKFRYESQQRQEQGGGKRHEVY